MPGLTKEQLAERKAAQEAEHKLELDSLRTQLLEAEQRALEATRQVEWYETRSRDEAPIVDTVATVPGQAEPSTDGAYLPDPQVAYDPFDSQNPHKILSDPPGFKLGWKSPVYRDGGRGWRGWVAVEYDDEIGRNLNRYLLDPPRRMEHAVDNYVRRGDSVLCYIERGIWEARQKRRTDLAARRAGEHAQDMRVDTIRREADLRPLPVAPNSIAGRRMSS